MRIVFAGTPEFAAGHLGFLLAQKQHEIIAVYTQPDRPSGRGKKLSASPVKQLAVDHHLPLYQPLSLRDKSEQDKFANLKPDIMIVVAYGLILPKTILQVPHYGCINVHASLLPRWRGAAPIQRAIEAGDKETGITIMQMSEGLDTGDILLKKSCPIDANDTAGSLHDKLLAFGQTALNIVLTQIVDHTVKPVTQDDAQSTYAKKITKTEAKLDWTQSATELERKIRAFNPFPITYFDLAGNSIRVWKARLGPLETSSPPGTIIKSNKEGILIATGNGSILLEQIQLPGKKVLSAGEILNANRENFSVGKILL